MTEKFRNKYRIPSARLQNWDYGSDGAYFITICTQNRKHYLGEIENRKMVLNKIGQHANTCFQDIPHHFPFVKIVEFVVMPNHVHAIIIINKSDETDHRTETDNETVETQNFASLQKSQSESQPQPEQGLANNSFNKFGPQSRNLASIVRGYKIGVTKFAKNIHADFAWQSRYHDHVIRNTKSFERIQEYIINNPRNWDADALNHISQNPTIDEY